MSRKRSYAFVLYPESCNSNWKEVLNNAKCNIFYILHDKDTLINQETDEIIPKKPHVHVLCIFNNPRNDTSVRKLCLQCGGNGHLENIVSTKGYARYLTHKDEEFKHKYDDNEVVTLGNLDYSEICATDEDKITKQDDMLADIIAYCNNNHIIAYCQLIDYCILHRRDWLNILKTRSGQLVSCYIKSKYWLQGL